jgi:hypothetical protein
LVVVDVLVLGGWVAMHKIKNVQINSPTYVDVFVHECVNVRVVVLLHICFSSRGINVSVKKKVMGEEFPMFCCC